MYYSLLVSWQDAQSWTSCPTQDDYTYSVTSELSLSLLLQTDSCSPPVLQHDTWRWAGPSWGMVSSKRAFQSLTIPELSLPLTETHYHRCLGIAASSPTEPQTAWLTWVFAFHICSLLLIFSWSSGVHHAVLCQVWVCGLPSWEDQLHWPGNSIILWSLKTFY